jgi:hypothetical protein
MAFPLLASERMRKPFMAAILCALIASATAQADGPGDLKRAQTMKTAGTVATIVGCLMLTAVFPIAWAVGWSQYPKSQGESALNAPFIMTLTLVPIGVAHLGVGIPLWSVGRAREKRAQRATASLTATGLSGTF